MMNVTRNSAKRRMASCGMSQIPASPELFYGNGIIWTTQRRKGEWLTDWKGFGRRRSSPNRVTNPTFASGIWGSTRNFDQANLCPSRHSNRPLPECESIALPLSKPVRSFSARHPLHIEHILMLWSQPASTEEAYLLWRSCCWGLSGGCLLQHRACCQPCKRLGRHAFHDKLIGKCGK